MWDWPSQLNAANFAGHNDWRLPSELGCNGPGVWGPPGYTCGSSDPHELETILLEPYGCGTSPCIDPIFGPTASNRYWSSSLSVPYAVQEWAVEVPERRCGAPSPGIQRLGPGGASRLVIGRYSNH